ncbi:hypothetical protein [Tenacibaculum singaporense]|uniref:Uncharacterized protein n=1 Tax=Tenacibaculum singaporense TaxID=2358479 RepID=A0A3Q8RRM8_9FLAO|nr:hypothetical protein [Tenacibaculum singaporense]AZJ35682.1 hypothetical protein D6T69_09180 [Tenacibaculum singaporense]
MPRDNFTKDTILRLAQRAGYTCSICESLTVGPSEEKENSVNITGVAAHISGASEGRGSRRYRSDMTTEERKSISNGIWLCETHADLIDGDEVTYTEKRLHEIKDRHETKVQYKHAGVNIDKGLFTEIEICNLATFTSSTRIKFQQNNLIIGQGSPGKTILCEFLASLKNPSLLKRWEDNKNRGNSFFSIKYFRTEELTYNIRIDSKRKITYDLNGVGTPVLIPSSTIFHLNKCFRDFVIENELDYKIKKSFMEYFGLREIEYLNFIADVATKKKYIIEDFEYDTEEDYLSVKLKDRTNYRSFQSLSSGEKDRVILEMTLQLAIFYSKFNSTITIIDQEAFPTMDSAGYCNLIKVVVENCFDFQFIVATFFEKNELPYKLLNTIELTVVEGDTKVQQLTMHHK